LTVIEFTENVVAGFDLCQAFGVDLAALDVVGEGIEAANV
jgi:hypothetical protein